MKNWILASLFGAWSLLATNAIANNGFDLDSYKGQVVYVDFWASWCIPCRASFPFMHELALEHGQELAIVAINVDKNREDADKFLKDFDINFDIIYDPDGNLAKDYGVKGMPTSYLYDENGTLIGTHVGFKKKDTSKLRDAVSRAVNAQN